MQDIHRLIKEYFDGTTGDAQERELREMLLSGRYTGEDVDEALAVMGYWAMKRGAPVRKRRSRVSWAAAACAVCALSVGAWMWSGHADRENECVAYVGGVEYSGDRATDIMDYQLGLMSSASQSVDEAISDELSEFADIFE